MILLILIAGILLLVKGADYFVAGSASIARKLGVSSLVIGLTLVAFGTSFPEFIVSITASLKNANEIALGNIIGSNIANIWLIIGISALFMTLPIRSSTVWKEIPLAIMAAVVFWIMINDKLFLNGETEYITRSEGLILLAFFIIFLSYTVALGLQERSETKTVKAEYKKEISEKTKYYENIWKSIAAFLGGLIAIVIGGRLIVESSIDIAEFFDISQTLTGLTIAAVGTSLPELAASVVAVYRREPDISVGNIIGSNIFNIFFVGGAAAIPHALPVHPFLHVDSVVVILTTLLIFIFASTKKRIGRAEGIISVILYIGYLGYILQRG